MRRSIITAVVAAFWAATAAPTAQVPGLVQFIFTSDAHYGLTRPTFRGRVAVDAHEVNAAMVEAVNALGSMSFPDDGGVGAAEPIGPVDFLAEGGDIANRMELDYGRQIQTATESFAQFKADYIDGIRLHDHHGLRTPVYAVPGNHDASNAVGFHRTMTPGRDPGSVMAIFNLMMDPRVPKTVETFDYARDRVLYSRDVGGLHVQFVGVWPDSVARAWMDEDLRGVPATTPVMIVAHDQVEGEAKHFLNPRPPHTINATDLFENLLVDEFVGGDAMAVAVSEQRELEGFLQRHPNVTAYFHGNSNWNQFYDYVGPDHTALLHVFRVDSPMKGRFSAADETRLSFQIATLNPASRLLTVREVLWNTTRSAGTPTWGASTTVALWPRPGTGWSGER